MKEEAAKLWSKALRSGRYKQGSGVLRSVNNEYCVMGVLCDVFHWKGWSRNPKTDFFTRKTGFFYDSAHDVLPVSVMQEAAMFDPRGELESGISLTELNDAGKSFEELADIIDANWRNL